MCNDPEQRWEQYIPSVVAGRLSFRNEVGGELDLINGSGHVLQKEKPLHGGRGKRRIRLAERGEESS